MIVISVSRNNFHPLLKKHFRKYGFALSETQLKRFTIYRNELKRWNRKINLTTIIDDYGIIVKHFVDSLSLLHYVTFEPSAKIADVGTGAGLPGLPLKIYRPDIKMTLIESSQKKVSFLKYLVSRLGLEGVEVIWKRAEELIDLPAYKAQYDFVLTRYVASIEDSLAYCLFLLKDNGDFIAYKSADIDFEVQQAQRKLKQLGAEISRILQSQITDGRTFLFIKKILYL